MSLAGRRTPSIFDEYARQRRAEQAEHGQRYGAPKPYRAEDAEDTPCPTCDFLAWPDSCYCPFCGGTMASPRLWAEDPRDRVRCPNCLAGNNEQSIFCDQCGEALPASAYADADQAKQAAAGVGVPGVWQPGGHPVSSSAGRRPGLSPAERNALLAQRNAALDQHAQRADLMAGYRPGDGEPFLHRLSRAEQLVEECERDLERAQQDFRDRRAEFGGDVDLAAGRYLDPERRDRYADYQAAEAGVASATAALAEARRLESAMLAAWHADYTPLGWTPDAGIP